MNKILLLICSVVVVTGCATNGYNKFYSPVVDARTLSDVEILQEEQEPKIFGTDDFNRDISILRAKGYIVVGESSFNGGLESVSHASDQAKEVGATVVLVKSEYTNTQTINSALFVPNNQTTYYSGSVYGGGKLGGYSGMSTTYDTTVIPYTSYQRRYDQNAIYFVKSNKKYKFGLIIDDLSPELRNRLERNTGALISIVVENTPAFYANVIPGDVLIAVDGVEVRNAENASYILGQVNSTTSSTLTIIRNMQERKILVQFGPKSVEE